MAVLNLNNICAAPWGAPLLQDISLELNAGDIHGVIGPNGAGKTSLLACISGDIALSGGSILLGAKPLQDWKPAERARSMAVLPQLSLLNFPYTVGEVVMLGRIPHDTGVRVDRQIVSEVLSEMDIQQLRERLYTQLSGGEKQRVQLARIFAQVWHPVGNRPRLILLDEPTTALDLSHQLQLMQLIRRLAEQGCTIVMVVHDFNLLSGIAGQLCALSAGRQVAQGSVVEVMTAAVFKEVFAVDVTITPHPGDGRPIVISS
ncbi:MAG: heme ABC transporter ATP-binding protein [Gammaproteobacteria bacterium]|nr:heme ABC transporter ATP-binding protein [Gammaproteobacteria bacterium]